jgi:hypothetical protein
VFKDYRKKPVVIQAWQVTLENIDDVIAWCNGSRGPMIEPTVNIETLEGVMTGRIGDYIIKGVQGEFYPCKPDIFEATYE